MVILLNQLKLKVWSCINIYSNLKLQAVNIFGMSIYMPILHTVCLSCGIKIVSKVLL